MSGLERLFLRITPIVMLICFICLGFTHTFDRQEQNNITYLTHETINVGTQEQPDNVEVYSFDFDTYIDNIDIDMLQRATSKTIDFERYKSNVDTFSLIWKDGYQFLDGVHTIINAIILVINSVITVINTVIFPVRIIAGMILTSMSLLGININADVFIINSQNWILDSLAIPLIKPAYNKDTGMQILGTKWLQNNWIQIIQNDDFGIEHYYNLGFHFTSQAGGNYKQLLCTVENGLDTVRYIDQNDNSIVVWQNGTWLYQDSKTITIASDNNFTNQSKVLKQILQYLAENANEVVQ